jgi:hypothetical protein
MRMLLFSTNRSSSHSSRMLVWMNSVIGYGFTVPSLEDSQVPDQYVLRIRSLWAGHSVRLTLSISPTLSLTTQTPTWRIQRQACSLQGEGTWDISDSFFPIREKIIQFKVLHLRFMPAQKAWIPWRWMFKYVSGNKSSDKDLEVDLQIIDSSCTWFEQWGQGGVEAINHAPLLRAWAELYNKEWSKQVKKCTGWEENETTVSTKREANQDGWAD